MGAGAGMSWMRPLDREADLAAREENRADFSRLAVRCSMAYHAGVGLPLPDASPTWALEACGWFYARHGDWYSSWSPSTKIPADDAEWIEARALGNVVDGMRATLAKHEQAKERA